IVAVVGWIIFMLFPVPILTRFSDDPALINVGKDAMRGLALAFPLIGYQNIGSSLFQAIGRAVPAIFLAFSRQVLFLIPLVFVMSKLWGLWGVWLSFPASDVIAFVVTLVWVRREMKQLKRMESLPQPPAPGK
ncbi:MAG: MATE family efflux transporter, partial [Acidobacteriota bacterium]|nr:MATE family efflux transporter [Acidobacteriota bacterium]